MWVYVYVKNFLPQSGTWTCAMNSFVVLIVSARICEHRVPLQTGFEDRVTLLTASPIVGLVNRVCVRA